MFHRDAGYLEGRRVRRSRETRAMARRTEFGKRMIANQWAAAEFNALGELWSLGLPIPYPVQIDGTEVLMEFIGEQAESGSAAPRLAQTRPEPALLADLFEQFRTTMSALAQCGWAHGDLSPYNTLLRDDRLVIIDWPQIVDIIAEPARARVPATRLSQHARVVRNPGSSHRRGGALRRLHGWRHLAMVNRHALARRGLISGC